MEGSTEKEAFIAEVFKHPSIWNTNSQLYKERNRRANAWNEISAALEASGKR